MWKRLFNLLFGIVVAIAFSMPAVSSQSEEPVYRVGQDVTAPKIISKVDPAYTDDARAARIQGTVTLECVVRKDGTTNVRGVVQSLGYGLDEQATAALQQWKFEPGKKSGEPVAVLLKVEVNFNLQ
jgi:protein TonB